MDDVDFFDFMMEGGDELLFPDNEVECPYCGYTVDKSDLIEVVDEDSKIIKCPNCESSP